MASLWMVPVYVTLHLACLHLCSGEIVNIAFNKPVNMSSRHESKRFPPEMAVDGNTTAVPPGIIHTSPLPKSTTPAWWWVDLQTQIQGGNVKIYFRTDIKKRRNGVQFYTSTNFSTIPDQPCYNFTGDKIPDDVSVNCSGTWRFLLVYSNTISKNTDQVPTLDFGEVTINVCSNGTYGQSCTKNCSSRHCAVASRSCDRYTGTCPGGCKPGWMGTDCTHACSNKFYGANCTNSCRSRNCTVFSTTCDGMTGVCHGGCKPGWKGTDCIEACSKKFYGANCTNSCSSRNCAVFSTTCDGMTGVCHGGCKPGWKGTDCIEVCSNGTYGRNCEGSCNSRQCAVTSATCDPLTGMCPPGGCKAGWTGADCAQAVSSVVPAVAGTMAGIAVIVTIIIVLIVYRRKRNSLSCGTYEQNGNRSLELDHVADMYVSIDHKGKVGSKEKQQQPTPAQKPTSKVLAIPVQEEEDEELLEVDEPSPDRDYYNESADVIREIPVTDLAATVQKIKRREGGFEAEYHRLPTGFTASYNDSKKPENAAKNKFKGYYPYDHNRVRLSLIPNIPGSDYINASFMHNYDQTKTYIASQAPKRKSVGDFWRMIWEHRCNRVIMLTGLVEDMKVKCYKYWPKDTILETDHFMVEVEVTDVRANYTVRHLKVTCKKSGQCRTVVQYHYTSWPDHGVPDTLALVQFISMIRQTSTSTDGPLLVHCSAGIGRTGTYIAIDSLLDQARNEGMVDVQGYVTAMRAERKNMIQTKEQYECVFHCLMEMTTFGNTSMDEENFTTSYSSRGLDSLVDRKTIRELTQIMIREDCRGPPDRHRMWVDGNPDFVVRVGPALRHLQGYLQVVSPSPGTERLLWKLVDENNVNKIIVFSQLQVNITGRKGTTKKYGDITVKVTAHRILTPDLSLEILQLRHANDDMSRNVQLYAFSRSTPFESMSSHLLDHAHLQYLSDEKTPVVLIHSETDRKCAAWFCIMANILSGILKDHRVDVIGHVRAFLKGFPELTITEHDVERFHKFAEKCVEMTSSSNTYGNL